MRLIDHLTCVPKLTNSAMPACCVNKTELLSQHGVPSSFGPWSWCFLGIFPEWILHLQVRGREGISHLLSLDLYDLVYSNATELEQGNHIQTLSGSVTGGQPKLGTAALIVLTWFWVDCPTTRPQGSLAVVFFCAGVGWVQALLLGCNSKCWLDMGVFANENRSQWFCVLLVFLFLSLGQPWVSRDTIHTGT